MVKPFILMTNDDGIFAPGLKYLWEALVDYADLAIVAPSTEKSAVGLGITIRDPLQIQQIMWEKNTPAWHVSGTPADCIRMGLSKILTKAPDLIVSGINRGSNAGRNVLYSGTVGGTIEGAMRGVPGIAFSCSNFETPNFTQAQQYVVPIVQYLLEFPLQKGSLLNVTFPETATIKGLRLARQGQGYWIEDLEERVHPEGHSYFWMGGKWNDHEEHEESDVALLSAGFAAAVPIHVNEMTDHTFLSAQKEGFDRLFPQ